MRSRRRFRLGHAFITALAEAIHVPLFFDAWSSMTLHWCGAPDERIAGSRSTHGLHEDGARALHYRPPGFMSGRRRLYG